MPSTIPYDPSLVLGNIVHPQKLDVLVAISEAQANADAAEDNLNSLIALKRSLDMTVQELAEMDIDTTELVKESQETGKKITQAAIDFAKTKLDTETKIQPLKAKIRMVSNSVESPIDYNKTQIKKMPLAADSIKLNCQYFAFDKNEQDSSSHAATIAAFVSGAVKEGGEDWSESYSAQAKTSAQEQVNKQHQNHSISGTLVVTITCTHKEAVLLAPFIMDPDKAIRAWNAIYPDDMIKTNSVESILSTQLKQDTKNEKTFSILSGQTCGSCFIGMVHTLNVTDTQSSESLYSVAETLQGQFNVGSAIQHYSGGFGIDASFANNARNLLSSQNISSHCTLTVMGSIPSIKSNTVQMAVKAFAESDGESPMKSVQAIQNATATEMDTIDSSAEKARTGEQFKSLKAASIEATLKGLSTIDDKNNKMIDVNSLMDAMEDYINKCLAGNIGLPINYYLKPITKSQVVQQWMAKYYPSKFSQIGSADDGKDSQN